MQISANFKETTAYAVFVLLLEAASVVFGFSPINFKIQGWRPIFLQETLRRAMEKIDNLLGIIFMYCIIKYMVQTELDKSPRKSQKLHSFNKHRKVNK